MLLVRPAVQLAWAAARLTWATARGAGRAARWMYNHWPIGFDRQHVPTGMGFGGAVNMRWRGFANHAADDTVDGGGATPHGVTAAEVRATIARQGEQAIARAGGAVGDGGDNIARDSFGNQLALPMGDGRWIGSRLPADETEEQAARLVGRVAGLRAGGDAAIEAVKLAGSRAGSTYRRQWPVGRSDLDVAIADWPMLISTRHYGKVIGRIKAIADEFTAATGIRVELHVRSAYPKEQWAEFFGHLFTTNKQRRI